MVLRLALVLLLSGCATTTNPPKSFYADWIAVTNPQQICAGSDSCVKHAQYRGKPLCTLITSDRDVSTSQVGVLMSECLK